MDALTLPADGWLFVAGGSGSIGTLAIQLARRNGWQVVASASQHNHEHMLSLGATYVVDYHDVDWPEQVRRWVPGGADAAIAIPPGTTAACIDVVRDHGQVVTVSGDRAAAPRGVQVEMFSYQLDVRSPLQELMNDIADRSITLVIENTRPFDEGTLALQKATTMHARGKTVLTVETGSRPER